MFRSAAQDPRFVHQATVGVLSFASLCPERKASRPNAPRSRERPWLGPMMPGVSPAAFRSIGRPCQTDLGGAKCVSQLHHRLRVDRSPSRHGGRQEVVGRTGMGLRPGHIRQADGKRGRSPVRMAASISGWPANERPTSPAARSRASSSVTRAGIGLVPGFDAWPSSLSIKKRLIASALAACSAGFLFGSFGRGPLRLFRSRSWLARRLCAQPRASSR